MKRSRAGFTMAELLVVFAVISVVAALLLAALARGRHHRDAAQCISNLRQLALANVRYAADNGATHLVVGRPILQAPDPALALEEFMKEARCAVS